MSGAHIAVSPVANSCAGNWRRFAYFSTLNVQNGENIMRKWLMIAVLAVGSLFAITPTADAHWGYGGYRGGYYGGYRGYYSAPHYHYHRPSYRGYYGYGSPGGYYYRAPSYGFYYGW